MSILHLRESDSYAHFDHDQCVAEGRRLAASYQSATPFPHIVIDDFLPTDLLRQVVAEFPSRDGIDRFDRPQERLKYQYNPNRIDSGLIRNLLAELNGEPFLAFLEAMTGIGGLIPDPYYVGGGLHETLSGGHLSIHADFNLHRQMQVERRLNLLVYLNDDWPDAYGGQLELWDREMRKAEVSVLPVMARAVVFNTTLQSYHGQPDPVACPPDRSRRSIATYYYTATPGAEAQPLRTTVFQPRPGTGERRDWSVIAFHLIEDWLPARFKPFALRLARRILR